MAPPEIAKRVLEEFFSDLEGSVPDSKGDSLEPGGFPFGNLGATRRFRKESG